MHAERLIKILAANPNPDPTEAELARALVMSDSPPRDMEAEAELSRALVRGGGDGLTACGEDAGLCPKPRLRHRRVNAGVWPNWRCVYVEWAVIGSRLCRAQDFTGRYPFNTCGTHQDHLKTIKRKERLAAFVKAQQQGAPVELWNMTGDELPLPFDLSPLQRTVLFDMARQSRNILDNMGIISPPWTIEELDRRFGGVTIIREGDAEPAIINPPDTTWYAQYPEPEVKASGTPHTGPSWQSKIIADN